MSVLCNPHIFGVSGGGGGPSEPDDFAGLELWLKGGTGLFQDDAATTPAVANGDVIAVWQDQSGNGRHATQTVNADRPTLDVTAGLNGINTVKFTVGNSQFFHLPNFAAAFSTAIEFWCVLRAENPTSFGEGIWRLGFGSDDIYAYVDGSIWLGVGSTTRFATGVPSGVTIQNYNTLRTVSKSGDFNVHFNGISHYSNGTNTVGWPTINIWIGKSASSSFWNGRIAEMFIYSQERSAGDRTSLASYINSRYGI